MSINDSFDVTHPDCRSDSFYRAAIPVDIDNGSPNPSNWGVPVASLESADCDPLEYFANHSIIFGRVHISLMPDSAESSFK